MPTGNKKTKRFGRFGLGILALALIWSVGYVGTLAWNKHRVEQKNHIQSREVEVEIQEEVPDKTVTAGAEKTKEVWFENTGSAAVFLRAAYVENWMGVKPCCPATKAWRSSGPRAGVRTGWTAETAGITTVMYWPPAAEQSPFSRPLPSRHRFQRRVPTR